MDSTSTEQDTKQLGTQPERQPEEQLIPQGRQPIPIAVPRETPVEVPSNLDQIEEEQANHLINIRVPAEEEAGLSLMNLYRTSIDENLDRSAEVLRISRELRLDPAFVSHNFDDIKKEEHIPPPEFWEQLEKSYPGTTQFLKKRENMLLARNDVERLAFLEAQNKAMKRATDHLNAGILQFERSFIQGWDRGFGGDKEKAEARIKQIDHELSLYDSTSAHPLDWTAGMVLRNAPMLAGSAAAGAVFGTGLGLIGGVAAAPGVALGVGAYRVGSGIGAALFNYRLFAGHHYNHLIEKKDDLGNPLPEDQVRATAKSMAAVDAGLTVLNLGKIAKTFKFQSGTLKSSVEKYLKEWAKTVGHSAAVMVGMQLVDTAGERAVKAYSGQPFEKDRLTPGQFGASMAEALSEGIGFGLVFGTPGLAFSFARERSYLRERSRVAQSIHENIAKKAKEMDLISLSKEAAGEFIKNNVAQGEMSHVYVSPKDFKEYFQSKGMDPAIQAERLGISELYQEAETTGNHSIQFQIPYDKVVVEYAKEGILEDLFGGIKFRPDDLTAKELNTLYQESLETEKRIRKELKETYEKAKKERGENPQDVETEKRISDYFRNHLNDITPKVGKESVRRKQIESQAQLAAQWYVAEAFKRNQPLDQFWDQERPTLVGPDHFVASKYREDILHRMRFEIEVAENVAESHGEQEGTLETPAYSTFPKYFKDKGYGKEETLNIIDKYILGKRLTPYQKIVLEDLYRSSGYDAKTSSDGVTFNQKADLFYSRLLHSLEEKLPNKSTPEQVRGILKEVNKEEIKWSGIDKFLEGKSKVDKQELLSYLSTEAILIQDVVLYSGEGAKYERYTLGGGTNYREILFTLPQIGQSVRTRHWSEEKGIFAHTRVTDRLGPEGKTLFIEEIQSDLHQKGREFGYREAESGVTDEKIEKARSSVYELKREIKKVLQSEYDDLGYESERRAFLEILADKNWKETYSVDPESNLAKMVDQYLYERETLDVIKRLAHDAPFRKNWQEYVLKRILKMAADEGYTAIQWTTGETQGKRYGSTQKRMEGMKGFYDKIIPDFLNKYTKKWGGRVTDAEIDVPLLDKVKVHSLEITDQIRKSLETEPQPLFQGEKVIRGSTTFANDQTIIRLTEHANASTFMHESAHHWLQSMHDYVQSGKADAAYVKNWETLSQWLEVKPDQKQLTTDQHEKFARGFEAYLREGKAPTPTLRAAFERFKGWLTSLYRSAKMLDVELTDEVRQFMDRMLVRESELNFAHEQLGFIESIDPALLSPELKAKYDEMKSAADSASRSRMTRADSDKALKAKLNHATDLATQAVEEAPLYAAIRDLNEGLKEWGLTDKELAKKFTEIEVASPLEVDDHWNRFAEKFIEISDLHEVDSSFLSDEILRNPTREEAIRAATDVLMNEELEFDALDALHNYPRLKAMALERELFAAMRDAEKAKKTAKEEELKEQGAQAETREIRQKINKMEKNAKVLARDSKRQAQVVLSDKTVKDATDTRMYMRAEKRARNDVLKAIKRKDWEAATRAQYEAILNHALATEALSNKKVLDAGLKQFQKIAKRGRSILEMPHGHVLQLDEMLRNIGVSQRLKDEIEPLREVAKTLLEEGASHEEIANTTGLVLDVIEGEPVFRPESLTEFESRLNQGYQAVSFPAAAFNTDLRDFKEISMRDFVEISDTVEVIQHLGKTFDRLTTALGEVRVTQAIEEMRAVSDARYNRRRESEQTAIELKKQDSMIQDVLDSKIISEITNLLNLAHQYDGGDLNGPFHRYLYSPLKRGEDKFYTRMGEMTPRIKEIVEKHFGENGFYDLLNTRVDLPIYGPGGKDSLYKLISMGLNYGNVEGRRRLIEGASLRVADRNLDGTYRTRIDSTGRSVIDRRKITEEELRDEVLSHLGEKEWAFIRDVWGLFKELYPESVALELKTEGKIPKKVKPLMVETRFGSFEGGYFPIVYETKFASRYGSPDSRSQSFKQVSKAKTNTGRMIERVAHTDRTLRLDLDVISEEIENTLYDLSVREAVIDVHKILSNPKFERMIKESRGEHVYRMLTKTLTDFAGDQAVDRLAPEGLLKFFRVNFSRYALGFRAANFLRDLGSNYFVAGHEAWVNGAYSTYNNYIKNYLLNVGDQTEFIHSRSVRMKMRGELRDRDLPKAFEDFKKGTGLFKTVNQFLDRYAYVFQTWADELLSHPMWLMIYEKNVGAVGEARAIDMADAVVDRTFGSGSLVNLAEFQRKPNEFLKTATLFSGYATMYANRILSVIQQAELSKDPAAKGKILMTAALWMYIGAGLWEASTKSLFRNADFDDEDKKRILLGPVEQMLYSVPVIGSAITGAASGYDKRDPLSVILSDVFKAIKDPTTGKVLRAASIPAGIPAQFEMTVENLMDALEKSDLKMNDLFSRREKKRRSK